MSQSLQNKIDKYKKGLLKTNNLQVFNKTFSDERISGEKLFRATFKNLNLINLNFNDTDLSSGFFKECSFKTCIFDNVVFPDGKFENCIFINCKFINCNLSDVDFLETTFDKCDFEKDESGSLVKTNFDSCHFLDTNFNGFEGLPLVQTSLIDSTFSKFNKSIEFKGVFFLIDLLQPIDGINRMFRKNI